MIDYRVSPAKAEAGEADFVTVLGTRSCWGHGGEIDPSGPSPGGGSAASGWELLVGTGMATGFPSSGRDPERCRAAFCLVSSLRTPLLRSRGGKFEVD